MVYTHRFIVAYPVTFGLAFSQKLPNAGVDGGSTLTKNVSVFGAGLLPLIGRDVVATRSCIVFGSPERTALDRT